ncbi:MAG: hypothetical protein M3Q28_07985 [Pseudomonadota bacterium]|nr:hypothetical protein [Pseudomonadota bacterium]
MGIGIAALTAAALAAAAMASAPSSVRQVSLAILAVLTGVFSWIASRRQPARPWEIGVSTKGEVELRGADSASQPVSQPARPFQLAFAAPWLISLRSGTMFIPVWPDSLPQSVYRRLWVHLRWKKAARSDDEQRSTSRVSSRFEDR